MSEKDGPLQGGLETRLRRPRRGRPAGARAVGHLGERQEAYALGAHVDEDALLLQLADLGPTHKSIPKEARPAEHLVVTRHDALWKLRAPRRPGPLFHTWDFSKPTARVETIPRVLYCASV